ncbi:hypothetical protein FKM82_022217 [Ascaphus truei]
MELQKTEGKERDHGLADTGGWLSITLLVVLLQSGPIMSNPPMAYRPQIEKTGRSGERILLSVRIAQSNLLIKIESQKSL